MKPKQTQALFAPGDITYSKAAMIAIKEAGSSGLFFLCRHLTGDWSKATGESQRVLNHQALIEEDDLNEIVSRYRLPGDAEIVITTHYVHTPSLRWTDICLADEMPAEDCPGEEEPNCLDPLVEAEFMIIETLEGPGLETEGVH